MISLYAQGIVSRRMKHLEELFCTPGVKSQEVFQQFLDVLCADARLMKALPIIQLTSAHSFCYLLTSFNWSLTDWKSRPVSGVTIVFRAISLINNTAYGGARIFLETAHWKDYEVTFGRCVSHKKIEWKSYFFLFFFKVWVLEYRNGTRVLGRPIEYSSTRWHP